jgi:hypothetical protein
MAWLAVLAFLSPALAVTFRGDSTANAASSLSSVPDSSEVLQDGEKVPLELLHLTQASAAARGVRGGPAASLAGNQTTKDASSNQTVKSLLSHTKKVGARIVEQLEDWKDHNMALRSKVGPEHSPTIMGLLDKSKYQSLIQSFVQNEPTRYVFNRGNKRAQTFIINHMKASGLTVTTQEFSMNFGSSQSKTENIIGELRGSSKPEEFVVLGAHYDSIPSQGNAPGADDNGSGLTSLLLSARALSQGGFKPKRTIRFVAFNAEEMGLVGSTAYVNQMSAADRENFHGAIILDQVGFRRDSSKTSVIFETSGRADGQQRIIDTMAHSTRGIPKWGTQVDFKCNYAGWGSDHMPFLQSGLPAVLLIERDNLYSADHFGHTSQDTLDKVDFSFAASVAAIATAAVGNLADPGDL